MFGSWKIYFIFTYDRKSNVKALFIRQEKTKGHIKSTIFQNSLIKKEKNDKKTPSFFTQKVKKFTY